MEPTPEMIKEKAIALLFLAKFLHPKKITQSKRNFEKGLALLPPILKYPKASSVVKCSIDDLSSLRVPPGVITRNRNLLEVQ